jgi:hypothetical protein
MSETTEKHSKLARLGRWLAELVLVFVSVYAAFWLNNYQQHQQEATRPDSGVARAGIPCGNREWKNSHGKGGTTSR